MLFDARLKNEFSCYQLDNAEQLLARGRVVGLRVSPDGSRIDGTVVDNKGLEERPFVSVRANGQPLLDGVLVRSRRCLQPRYRSADGKPPA